MKNMEILIGLDYCYQIVTREIFRGKNNEPIALGFVFGYISRVHLNITRYMFRTDTINKELNEIKELKNPFEKFHLNNIYDGREELYLMAYQNIETRDPSRILAGPYKNRKTGTPMGS